MGCFEAEKPIPNPPLEVEGVFGQWLKIRDNQDDYCIEMETGTGKTLVYIRTIYELYKHYGLTKFIIIVPSIAIKEGVLTTLETFKDQLSTLYGEKIAWFEYDSKKLSRLKHFISDTQPQIMVMTIQSFTADDRIILIRTIELDEMLRGLAYHDAGPGPDLSLFRETIETYLPTRGTPKRGVYDKIICDSNSRPEREFALNADSDNEVVCFLKLPDFYEIPTPIGKYRPDFGLVLKRKSLKSGDESDYYFVIETKSTADLDDKTALTDSERYKIKCAQKHFASLGIPAEIAYMAPVAEYNRDFKNKVK